MSEPPALRVSDREREATVTLLREAAGEGRLTLEELSERVELAYAARVGTDLAELTADLPTGLATPSFPAPATWSAPPETKPDWVVAVMSGADRRGPWRMRRLTKVVAVMGGCELDLRQAQLPGPEVEILAITVMGGIDVIVPDGVVVEMGGFALMGANENRGSDAEPPPPPGAPVVRVRAYSLMGGVDVKRKRAREVVAEKLHAWRGH